MTFDYDLTGALKPLREVVTMAGKKKRQQSKNLPFGGKKAAPFKKGHK